MKPAPHRLSANQGSRSIPRPQPVRRLEQTGRAAVSRRPPQRPRPPLRRPRSGGQRYVAAGQILGVGLVCFALWLLFDARQLYVNAQGSPPGTRRTVSMDLIGPIARVEEFFGLDRLVDGGNRALGRASTPSLEGTLPTTPPPLGVGTPTSSTAPTTTTLPASGTGVLRVPPFNPLVTPATTPAYGNGLGVDRPRPFTPLSGVTSSTSPTSPTGTTVTTVPPSPASAGGLPPLVTPTPAHPLTVLEIGDSLGVDLGYGLQDVLGGSKAIHLNTKAVIDTGLANVAYYDWPAVLSGLLKSEHPGLVVVMVGGNDTQNFAIGQTAYQFGTAAWRAAYLARVEGLMREATAAGAHVVWVGMPQMQPGAPVTSAQMATLDSVYAQAARTVPGTLYVPTWKVLANSKGQYTTFLPNASGALVAVRDPDGVHLDYPAGDDLVAQAIVSALKKSWKVQL